MDRDKGTSRRPIVGKVHESKRQRRHLVNRLYKSLEKGQLDDFQQYSTIHRVSSDLRQLQSKYFDPEILTIGPFHYSKKTTKNIEVMNGHKMLFLRRLLGGKFEGTSGCEEPTPEGGREESIVSDQEDEHPASKSSVRLEDLALAMRKLEKKARACYSEMFPGISTESFVEMMILDGCFVVELLRLHYEYKQTRKSRKKTQSRNCGAVKSVELLLQTPWILRTLRHDLLLLENQLPLFVLQELFDQIEKTVRRAAPVTLQDLAIHFFNPYLPHPSQASRFRLHIGKKEPKKQEEYAHLLDAVRLTFIEDKRYGEEPDNYDGSIRIRIRNEPLTHSASELEELGVEFREDRRSKLLNLSFNKWAPPVSSRPFKFCGPIFRYIFPKPTLKIPPLIVDHDMIPLFLNVVAYEQCDKKAKPFFTHYFVFLKKLVHNSVDVQLLHKRGILKHAFGSSEDVVAILRMLCEKLDYNLQDSYLHEEVDQINAYCEPYDDSALLKCYRDMIRKYFSSPWSCISVFVAGMLLVLTIIATVYNVLTYYHPHK